MAYEAASGSLDEDILNLFVASNIRKDAAWYAVNEGLDTAAQVQKEAEAAMKLLPRTNTLLDMLEMEPYAVAPITSDEQWRRYVDSLETYGEEMIPMRSVVSQVLCSFSIHDSSLTASYDYFEVSSIIGASIWEVEIFISLFI